MTDEELASGQPPYLHSFARPGNLKWKNTMPVYLNGQKIGDSVTGLTAHYEVVLSSRGIPSAEPI